MGLFCVYISFAGVGNKTAGCWGSGGIQSVCQRLAELRVQQLGAKEPDVREGLSFEEEGGCSNEEAERRKHAHESLLNER